MEITKDSYSNFRVFNPFQAIRGNLHRLSPPDENRTAWYLRDESSGILLDIVDGGKTEAIRRATQILTQPDEMPPTNEQLEKQQDTCGHVFGVVSLPKEDIESTCDLTDYLRNKLTHRPLGAFTYDIVGVNEEEQTINFFVTGILED